MLEVFHARGIQSGWFVESLATQSLIIFVIRTRRVPFLRSRPSVTPLAATLSCVAAGAVLPCTPVAPLLRFSPLPLAFFAILVGLVAVYLALVEVGKFWFFRPRPARPTRSVARPLGLRQQRLRRLAGRWTHRWAPGRPLAL
jgi:Mg2+-importing ATPase